MKKYVNYIALMLITMLIFAACNLGRIEPDNSQTLTNSEIEALYQRAVEAFSWFHMESMPADAEDTIIDENGHTYFRVAVDGISSLADLEAHLHTIFAPDVVKDLMDFPPVMYREFDGALFSIGASRGGDLLRGYEAHEIIRNIREDNPNIIYRVTVDILDRETLEEVVGIEVYDFVLSQVNGKWVFLNFNMVR